VPGCGNFGILNALKKALVELDLEPTSVDGLRHRPGGKLPHYTRGNVLKCCTAEPSPLPPG